MSVEKAKERLSAALRLASYGPHSAWTKNGCSAAINAIESLVRAIVDERLSPKQTANCACIWYAPVPKEWKFCPDCGGIPPRS